MSSLLIHTPTLSEMEWDHATQFVAVGQPIREAINDVGCFRSWRKKNSFLQLQASDAFLSETYLMMQGLRQNIASVMDIGPIAQTLGQHALDELNRNYPDPTIDPSNLGQR
jgi:hypothetical protein